MMATSKKLCPHLHIPLQSGDDAILAAMNRRHDVRTYVSLVERAMLKVPGLGLGTDLMVGFPAETDAAFANTAAIAAEVPFAYLHVFAYSPRPGTAAQRLKGRVPASAVKKRSEVLREIGARKRLAFHNKQIGLTTSVLFEQGLHDGFRCGTTPNFTKVAVAGPDDLHNRIKPVTITAATDRWTIGQIKAADQAGRTVTVL